MRTFAVAVILAAIGCLVAGSIARADGLFGPIIFGSVNANGTSQHSVKSFIISHPSTGYYVITFAPWVFGKTPPVCLVTPLGAGFSVAGEFYNVSSCRIYLTNQSGPADTIFLFMAGPVSTMPTGH